MAESPKEDLAQKLLAPGFARSAAEVRSLADPIADTPMVVTLDQLRPYSGDPRVTRNPRYSDIKSSIRERGLDAPPTITRRPGDEHFIIRNGGNTRLAILRELWAETREERFFRIACLFRPWSARGEIVALTGHLAENELRGGLSFIERALGVEKARELYEAESGTPLTQTELARRLTSDGYPVTQSHISRMQDAVRYLLPAIPTMLYGGLGKPQIERLTALRRVGARVWDRHALEKSVTADFTAHFQEVLSLFDGDPNGFDIQRIQDELIGQMAHLFGADYDALALELMDADARHHALTQEPLFHVKPESGNANTENPRTPAPQVPAIPSTEPAQQTADSASSPARVVAPTVPSSPSSTGTPNRKGTTQPERPRDIPTDRVQGHIVSPAQSTERLQAIQRTIAEATGEPVPDFRANVVRAIPVQAGGLHPISDVWYIEPALDSPDRLRVLIAQLAREIAQEVGVAERIEANNAGVGFVCTRLPGAPSQSPPSFMERAVLGLLNALSAPFIPSHRSGIDGVRLGDDIGLVLQGASPARRGTSVCRLSDTALVKLFRLIRLARRLVDLESSESLPPDGTVHR